MNFALTKTKTDWDHLNKECEKIEFRYIQRKVLELNFFYPLILRQFSDF
jgi:hypothetical protein